MAFVRMWVCPSTPVSATGCTHVCVACVMCARVSGEHVTPVRDNVHLCGSVSVSVLCARTCVGVYVCVSAYKVYVCGLKFAMSLSLNKLCVCS